MKIKNNTGFSLIELVVVIAIISILLAIAVPNFIRWRDNSNLREQARNISSDILLNKQRAAAENVRYRITFNSGTNDYVIQRESVLNANDFAADVSAVTKLVNPENTAITILGTPSFSGGVPAITLEPRGTSTAGSLVLQHTRRLSTATITANIMGRINVQYVYQ